MFRLLLNIHKSGYSPVRLFHPSPVPVPSPPFPMPPPVTEPPVSTPKPPHQPFPEPVPVSHQFDEPSDYKINPDNLNWPHHTIKPP